MSFSKVIIKIALKFIQYVLDITLQPSCAILFIKSSASLLFLASNTLYCFINSPLNFRLFLLPVAATYGNMVAYCNITKFTGYIFKLDNSGGKTHCFEDWGYNIGDSENLKEEFERQAKEKYANGEYKLHHVLDEFGQRITIEIALQDKEKNVRIIKTGWLVHPLGFITCATSFSGEIR